MTKAIKELPHRTDMKFKPQLEEEDIKELPQRAGMEFKSQEGNTIQGADHVKNMHGVQATAGRNDI